MRSTAPIDVLALAGVVLIGYAALSLPPPLTALVVGALLVLCYVMLETRR